MSIKSNRKALFNYEVIKKYEAGIVLEGWEVKSIKSGNFTFGTSFVVIRKNELWLIGLNVGNWPGARRKTDEIRKQERKLLLKKEEIRRISSLMNESKRLTIVPLSVFLRNNLIKVEIAIVRGKRQYEKKEKKKKKDFERSMQREMKHIR